MAAEVCKSDIIIAIHPKHVANIVSRVKNHEFRKYLLPPEVRRLWIYETRPASSIKYVATVSPGKRPGEICDPGGLRNDEFDEGRLEHLAKYAYEIRRLDALTIPLSLSDLKQNGWLNGPPQKYCYVKQSMLEVLKATPPSRIFDSTTTSAAEDGTNSGSGPNAVAETDNPGVANSQAKAPPSPQIPKSTAIITRPTPRREPPRPAVRRPAQTFAGVQKPKVFPALDRPRQVLLHDWLEKDGAR